MTLEEAIKEYQKGLQIGLPLVYLSPEAARLGIEALELIKNVREQKTGYLNPLPSYLLPSEEEK